MQRGDRGALDPGREGDGLLDPLGADVVVHHHVGARHQHALEPPQEHLEPGRTVRAGTSDQHRLGLQDRLAEDLEPGVAQRAPGLDDVGDHVGDAELHARLDGAVEAGHGGVDPVLLEVAAHHSGVRRGDALAAQVADRAGRAQRRREVEPRATEAEREHLLGLRAGVEQQVATGDADVEGALADVQRDVARAQVEELDAVVTVGEGESLGVGALLVAGFAQHVDGRLRQRALVGDREAEKGFVGHGGAFRGVCQRCA
jgi:hypothetical protein